MPDEPSPSEKASEAVAAIIDDATADANERAENAEATAEELAATITERVDDLEEATFECAADVQAIEIEMEDLRQLTTTQAETLTTLQTELTEMRGRMTTMSAELEKKADQPPSNSDHGSGDQPKPSPNNPDQPEPLPQETPPGDKTEPDLTSGSNNPDGGADVHPDQPAKPRRASLI